MKAACQGRESEIVPGSWLAGNARPSFVEGGKADAAIRLEQLWDELAAIYEVIPYAGIRWPAFMAEKDQHVFQSICAEHSAVHS